MKSHHILCLFCYSLSLAAAAVSLSATDSFGLHLWVDIVIAHVVSTLVIFRKITKVLTTCAMTISTHKCNPNESVALRLTAAAARLSE